MPWTQGELLGEGAFGKVFECLNDDGTICAAKVMPLRQGDDARAKAAQAEIEKEVRCSSLPVFRLLSLKRVCECCESLSMNKF